MKCTTSDGYSAWISEQEYRWMKFQQSIAGMSPEDQQQQKLEYTAKRDDETIDALSERLDFRSRMEAFVGAIYDAINTDTEPWDEKGRLIRDALLCNSAEMMLVALCGLGANFLAKRALLIPDDGRDFYQDDPTRKLEVFRRGGTVSKGRCRIDVCSHKVYGYSQEIMAQPEEIAMVTVVVQPLGGKKKYRFLCVPREERGNDSAVYWYSTDPENSRDPEPVKTIRWEDICTPVSE